VINNAANTIGGAARRAALPRIDKVARQEITS
jgi:hypothetical protein